MAPSQPRPWYHATYHSIISILGIGGLLPLPYSYAYLGWSWGTILLLASTATSFLSGRLLIACQDATRYRTYSAIGDAIMGDGWARRWVRPAQGLVFFTVIIAVVIGVGQLLSGLDSEANQGSQSLSLSAWIAVAGALLLLVSSAPDVERSWGISLGGSMATAVAVVMFIVGSGAALAQERRNGEEVEYGRPEEDTSLQYFMGNTESFGIIAFAYGGHSIIPDLHASLGHIDKDESRQAMRKAWTGAYLCIVPSYFLVLNLSYAAFGSDVSAFLIDNLKPYVSHAFLYVLYGFSLVNFFCLGAIYNQAAFVYIGEMFDHCCCSRRKMLPSHVEAEDDKNNNGKTSLQKQIAIRVSYIGCGTLVGAMLPFFGDFVALSGAVGITPCTFVYPFWLYNCSKEGREASSWRRIVNWILAGVFLTLGTLAAIGSIYNIAINASSYHLFHS